MKKTIDVLVVGCGAIGLSIALNLAIKGAKVCAIDRVGPGKQTSARAAGQSVIAQTDPGMGRLMHRSIASVVEFEQRTGVPISYHQAGSIKYAMADWSAEQLEREVRRANALGAVVDLILPSEAEKLAPHTDASHCRAAWYAPDDIYFHPPDMLDSFHKACLRFGVEFRFGPDVSNVLTKNGGVVGVASSEGDIYADAVVIAAGPWTSGLLQGIGIAPLPLLFVRHQYSIRSGIVGIRPDLPTVRIVDHAVYARPDGANLLFGTYEPLPEVIDSVPDRTEGVSLDPAATEMAIDKVCHIYRGLDRSRIEEMRGGVTAMTPDGRYLIDEAPTAKGLFFVTGCNVMGLSVSPAVGEDMAAWLTSGRRPDDLSRFAITRFSADRPSNEDIRKSGLKEYESIYRDAEASEHVRKYGHTSLAAS
ncbi:NAD(P)/FAD-dependent oxidoreductase [Tardiphaga sp. 866_E4_N2_1]|jgi:4-methylaminobutanoate oxidase (formaldehyde-forming)|uniref:NAD(P)/FAD-dependent oxidoreductase n=1 Tax=unclassified Tardiphaga TaxID=2631404 RepID=UPI003F27DBA3